MSQIRQPRRGRYPASGLLRKPWEGREGLPSLKQKESQRKGRARWIQEVVPAKRSLLEKEKDYLEAVLTEAGKLMGKYARLLLLTQQCSHANLPKLSAEGLT